jgi:hypothetical protein
MSDTLELSETGLTHTEWLRSEIAAGSNRSLEQVTDVELATRYMRYGRAEWEPRVADDVRAYLSSKGFALE